MLPASGFVLQNVLREETDTLSIAVALAVTGKKTDKAFLWSTNSYDFIERQNTQEKIVPFELLK